MKKVGPNCPAFYVLTLIDADKTYVISYYQAGKGEKMNYFLIVFLIGSLILVHELGHFLAAQWLKIPVARFSIGFGPKYGVLKEEKLNTGCHFFL